MIHWHIESAGFLAHRVSLSLRLASYVAMVKKKQVRTYTARGRPDLNPKCASHPSAPSSEVSTSTAPTSSDVEGLGAGSGVASSDLRSKKGVVHHTNRGANAGRGWQRDVRGSEIEREREREREGGIEIGDWQRVSKKERKQTAAGGVRGWRCEGLAR